MLEVRETDEYRRWFERLRDVTTRGRILARIRHYVESGKAVVILLVGGDKGSQQRDIEKAKELARGL